jgi:hypothetical protein
MLAPREVTDQLHQHDLSLREQAEMIELWHTL